MLSLKMIHVEKCSLWRLFSDISTGFLNVPYYKILAKIHIFSINFTTTLFHNKLTYSVLFAFSLFNVPSPFSSNIYQSYCSSFAAQNVFNQILTFQIPNTGRCYFSRLLSIPISMYRIPNNVVFPVRVFSYKIHRDLHRRHSWQKYGEQITFKPTTDTHFST
jgi:hypothetical protein